MLNIILVTVWAEMLNKLPVDHPMVISILVTCVTAVLGALFTFLGVILKFILNVDRAVNNRGPSDPKLYDLAQSANEKATSHERRLTRVETKVDSIEYDTKTLVGWREGFAKEDVPIKTGQEARHWMDREALWKDQTDGRLDDLEKEEKRDQKRLDRLEDKQ